MSAMHVGVCRVKLRLPEKSSLKEKRQVVRSLSERLRNKFNLSVAEVDDLDSWQIASLGLTCVSNDSRHAQEMLSNAIAFIEHTRLDAELLDYEVEVTPAF
jgi:uncharacterized protein YlxP (DUF503 family)